MRTYPFIDQFSLISHLNVVVGVFNCSSHCKDVVVKNRLPLWNIGLLFKNLYDASCINIDSSIMFIRHSWWHWYEACEYIESKLHQDRLLDFRLFFYRFIQKNYFHLITDQILSKCFIKVSGHTTKFSEFVHFSKGKGIFNNKRLWRKVKETLKNLMSNQCKYVLDSISKIGLKNILISLIHLNSIFSTYNEQNLFPKYHF